MVIFFLYSVCCPGDDEEGGWDNLDLDIPADAAVPEVSHEAAYFVTPSAGIPKSQNWIQNSSLAGEHAAAGSFDSAMRLLSRQLGIQNFTPLRNVFLELHLASQALLPTLVSVPGLSLFLERGWTDSSPINAKGSPAILTKLSSLEEKLNVAYKATTDGKFTDALRYEFSPFYFYFFPYLFFSSVLAYFVWFPY